MDCGPAAAKVSVQLPVAFDVPPTPDNVTGQVLLVGDPGSELTLTDWVGPWLTATGVVGVTMTVTVTGTFGSVGDGVTGLMVVVVIAFAIFQEPFTGVMA